MATVPEQSPSGRARSAERGFPPLNYLGRWAHQPPVWREGRAATEYMRLLRDPIFRGKGVPRGHGRPILLIPGFLAGDSSLSVMNDWLHRVDYHSELPGITLNVRYSEIVLKSLTLRLVDLYAWMGMRVTLVGHSRGGILAKVLSHRHPQMVERVVTLGSPLGDPFDLHPLTLAGVRIAQAVNLFRYARTASVEKRFLRDLAADAAVPITSIYSKSDGIVHWEACLRPDVEAVEVDGSHVGLGVNREVYAVLARLLAERASRRRKPAPVH